MLQSIPTQSTNLLTTVKANLPSFSSLQTKVESIKKAGKSINPTRINSQINDKILKEILPGAKDLDYKNAINVIKKAVYLNFNTIGTKVAGAMIDGHKALLGQEAAVPFLTHKVVALAALVARFAIGILLTGVEIAGALVVLTAGGLAGTFPIWLSIVKTISLLKK